MDSVYLRWLDGGPAGLSKADLIRPSRSLWYLSVRVQVDRELE